MTPQRTARETKSIILNNVVIFNGKEESTVRGSVRIEMCIRDRVEDVRKYYMDQVPMRKGTGPEDVTKAVLYLIEQTCETGQAVPVTGGQVMLS